MTLDVLNGALGIEHLQDMALSLDQVFACYVDPATFTGQCCADVIDPINDKTAKATAFQQIVWKSTCTIRNGAYHLHSVAACFLAKRSRPTDNRLSIPPHVISHFQQIELTTKESLEMKDLFNEWWHFPVANDALFFPLSLTFQVSPQSSPTIWLMEGGDSAFTRTDQKDEKNENLQKRPLFVNATWRPFETAVYRLSDDCRTIHQYSTDRLISKDVNFRLCCGGGKAREKMKL
jgi:hypothetical protein